LAEGLFGVLVLLLEGVVVETGEGEATGGFGGGVGEFRSESDSVDPGGCDKFGEDVVEVALESFEVKLGGGGSPSFVGFLGVEGAGSGAEEVGFSDPEDAPEGQEHGEHVDVAGGSDFQHGDGESPTEATEPFAGDSGGEELAEKLVFGDETDSGSEGEKESVLVSFIGHDLVHMVQWRVYSLPDGGRGSQSSMKG
jgi:hypothetical protein